MSISLAAVGSITFTCRSTAGSVSVPGLKVGDMVGFGYCPATSTKGDLPNNIFEGIISVADEIQQLANIGGTFTWTIFFYRAA